MHSANGLKQSILQMLPQLTNSDHVPLQIVLNQAAYINFLKTSNGDFASGLLPETFREPSGTLIKQQLPGKLLVSLPETFRELPELR